MLSVAPPGIRILAGIKSSSLHFLHLLRLILNGGCLVIVVFILLRKRGDSSCSITFCSTPLNHFNEIAFKHIVVGPFQAILGYKNARCLQFGNCAGVLEFLYLIFDSHICIVECAVRDFILALLFLNQDFHFEYRNHSH